MRAMSLRAVYAVWLNDSQGSRLSVGMNKSAITSPWPSEFFIRPGNWHGFPSSEYAFPSKF